MNDLYEATALLDLFSAFLPEEVNESIEYNGAKINLKKKDGHISFEIVSDNTFNDSEIKQQIVDYKKNLENLDNDIFLEALEDIKKVIDIKEFDELLKKESFDEESADKVSNMIAKSSEIISNHLRSKINNWIKIYNNFKEHC